MRQDELLVIHATLADRLEGMRRSTSGGGGNEEAA